VGLLFANHRVGIQSTIQVKENGETSFYSVPRQPYNYFEFNPVNTISGPTPMDIKITSINGDVIQFTLNSITPDAIIDTGYQFPVPVISALNPDAKCDTCISPRINNDQPFIFQDSFFPALTGVWLPPTQQQWADWSGKTWTQASSDPYLGTFSAQTDMVAWDTLNFGCNIPTPQDQVISFDFAVRLASGTTSEAAIWFDNYAHIPLPLLNTSWVHVSIPIANSRVISGTIHNVLIQNGREALTYFIDEMEFVLPKPPLCGGPVEISWAPTSLPSFFVWMIASLFSFYGR